MNRSTKLVALLLSICGVIMACRISFASDTIPSPQEFLGYALGEEFTPHYRVLDYVQTIAQQSPRVEINQYGSTVEGRELVLLTISDPDNLQRLEEIRTELLQLTDPRKISNETIVDKTVKNTPGVLWLSYGVHGNESCSSEAAMQVIYHLATAQDEETLMWLKSLVIIIDPMLNPDGRERYVNYYRSVVGRHANKEGLAVEHREPYPGGRFNHYLFDLNRDWTWLVQKETRLRLKQYQKWYPQVHVDFHEMGYTSSYFFFPAASPVNPLLPPTVVKWGKMFGKGNAEMFDQKGIPYFSGEVFDLFYPGYGDCYPSFNGAIGMTYEQGGGGYAGLVIERPNKTLLTLKDRLNDHYIASLATIKTFAHNKDERVRDFYKFWQSALDKSNLKGPRYVMVKPGKDTGKDRAFVQLLLNHQIEVQKAVQNFTIEASHYGEENVKKNSFTQGTWVIDLLQPHGYLARALLEPKAQKLDTLFFYDITSWSLPYAYNLDAYWSKESRSLALEPVTEVKIQPVKPLPEAKVAYVVSWGNLDAVRFLSDCFKENIRVRMAHREFTLNDQHFSRGTLVILMNDNHDIQNLHQKIENLGAQNHIPVMAAQTGFTENGVDLGSSQISSLYKPKILLLRDRPVSPTDMGVMWNMLENQFNYFVTIINVDELENSDLNDYNVLIMPADRGRGRGYQSAIDSTTVKKIKNWVRKGGTLIGVEGGAYFLTKDMANFSSVTLRKEKKESEEKDKKNELSPEEIEKRKRTLQQKEEDQMKERVPGTIVKVKLDTTHPLAYGMPDIAYVLKNSNASFELGKGYNVGIYSDNSKVTGYLSEKNLERINGGGFLYLENMGRGQLVMFADDPNFRGFWQGLTQLFMNAVFLFANETE